MKFEPTPLPGAFVITPERLHDERGWFARTFSRSDFAERGLNPDVLQCNLSSSSRRGTLRGMHYQRPPHAEAKLVRCARGAIYDVIVDLRPSSPAFRRHFGVRLDPTDDRMLYVPEGLRPRLPDARGRLGRLLPDVARLRAFRGGRRALERSGLRDRVAVRADRDGGEGSELSGLHGMRPVRAA